MLNTEQGAPVDLEELQRYIDDEREKQERAKKAEVRAQLDAILEAREARMAAASKADREKAARECPGGRTAEFLHTALGDKWPEFIHLFRASTMDRLMKAVNRIEAERENILRRQNVENLVGAASARQDAKQAVVTERKSRIERELAALGVMTDVTPEVDA